MEMTMTNGFMELNRNECMEVDGGKNLIEEFVDGLLKGLFKKDAHDCGKSIGETIAAGAPAYDSETPIR